jgi:hypothetical protein
VAHLKRSTNSSSMSLEALARLPWSTTTTPVPGGSGAMRGGGGGGAAACGGAVACGGAAPAARGGGAAACRPLLPLPRAEGDATALLTAPSGVRAAAGPPIGWGQGCAPRAPCAQAAAGPPRDAGSRRAAMKMAVRPFGRARLAARLGAVRGRGSGARALLCRAASVCVRACDGGDAAAGGGERNCPVPAPRRKECEWSGAAGPPG